MNWHVLHRGRDRVPVLRAVQPDLPRPTARARGSDLGEWSVYSLNPGIAFHSDWLSTDRIQLIYGRRFYSHAADPNSAQPLRSQHARARRLHHLLNWRAPADANPTPSFTNLPRGALSSGRAFAAAMADGTAGRRGLPAARPRSRRAAGTQPDARHPLRRPAGACPANSSSTSTAICCCPRSSGLHERPTMTLAPGQSSFLGAPRAPPLVPMESARVLVHRRGSEPLAAAQLHLRQLDGLGDGHPGGDQRHRCRRLLRPGLPDGRQRRVSDGEHQQEGRLPAAGERRRVHRSLWRHGHVRRRSLSQHAAHRGIDEHHRRADHRRLQGRPAASPHRPGARRTARAAAGRHHPGGLERLREPERRGHVREPGAHPGSLYRPLFRLGLHYLPDRLDAGRSLRPEASSPRDVHHRHGRRRSRHRRPRRALPLPRVRTTPGRPTRSRSPVRSRS